MNEISSLSGAFEYVNESGIKINGLSNVNGSLSTHYIVYRIDNLINGKYYIGQHKTDDPFDNYMGSGNLIIAAEKKYGLSAFSKTILFDFNNFKEIDNKEKELVPLSICYPFCLTSYNIKEGGKQGHTTPGRYKGKKNPRYGKNPFEYKSYHWIKNFKRERSIKYSGSKNPNFKYPYEIVVQMLQEYNINGFIGVVKKFNYKASKGKLQQLFLRNNLQYSRQHFKYTDQQINNALKIIKQYGFCYYAQQCYKKFGFKPHKGNFKAILKSRKLYKELKYV